MPFHALEQFRYVKFLQKPSTFRTMSGEDKFIGIALIQLKILNIMAYTTVWIVDKPSFKYDILLGLDIISKFRLRQDEFLQISQAPPPSEPSNDNIINWNEAIPTSLFEAKVSHLSSDQQSHIYNLIDKYGSVFAKNEFDIGSVTKYEAHIQLLENKYTTRKPYRCSFTDQQEIERQIADLLNHSMIEESCSPFAAPVTMAYKKTGDDSTKKKVRMCIDFRDLNKLIVPESQPFPLIEDMIVRTRNCTWFTALDINSAFWSIPIRTKDRYKTAFVTQNGHYEWCNMPFGLKTSPAIFQRILSGIIRCHNLTNFCCNYIDDILIFSESFDEHLSHIELLLQAIISEGFKLKFLKCNVAQHSIKYLGHIISKNSVRPLSDNLIAIRNFPVPSSRKNIRQFLGKINFYHKYIPNAAQALEPFHNLLRKDVTFEWTPLCQSTFEKVKSYLTSSPILAIFDPSLPISIYTDASGCGIGTVLKQTQSDRIEKPVAYFSKKLNAAQQRKKAIYIETFAVQEAIKFWKHWLQGRHFHVVTDHKPLTHLNFKSRPDEELGDMATFLMQYDFEIIYRPGSANTEADCLSRNPVLPSDSTSTLYINLLTSAEILISQTHLPSSLSSPRTQGFLTRTVKSTVKILLDTQGGLELIKRVHLRYGHIGSHHIYNTIKDHYHFHNMYRHITKFTSSCEVCIQNKSRRYNNLGLLGQLGPASRPYEIMSLDTVGGFGGRRSTKRYLHILVDHFTRFAYILTSANQTTSEFIRLMCSVIRDHPIETLLTDQYGGLASKEFKEFLHKENIKHLFTAVDHPQSNGLNECLGQTLVNRIRCRINETNTPIAWSTVARRCTDEYNETVHSTTQFPPSYLLIGRRDAISPLSTPSTYSSDLRQAFDNSLKYHQRNKIRLDSRKTNISLLTGDLVYITNGNRLNRNKLDPIRLGPFPVHRRLSNTVYEIDVCHGQHPDLRLYHISKLFQAI